MTKKDKRIIHEILNYIGSNSFLEKDIAIHVAKIDFEMSEDEFSEWLSKVKVLDK